MIKIKDKYLEIPLIQGGMGIGVSMGNLAGHVAACGGMGVISTANAGFACPDFWRNAAEDNLNALREQIAKAKKIAAGAGMIAINAMVATTQWFDAIKTAVECGIDAVISGAGLPLTLPELTKGTQTAAAPIVSSGRAAKVICRTWDKRYGVAPDFVVIEGSKAGGHLGFDREDLLNGTVQTLEEILPDVKAEIAPYEEKYGREIPIFVAGGIYTGEEIAHFTKLGAAGVQMATRFIATHECDASEDFKRILLNAKKEDVLIVQSPVGMPGRALNTPLMQRLAKDGKIPHQSCAGCIKTCKPTETPYCITKALIEAVNGNYEEGLFFCGSEVWRLDKIVHVKELIDELMKDWRANI